MSGLLLEHATIKHYQIERHLAVGGMSNVYLARDMRTDAEVALKVVPQDISDYSERFLREAKVTFTLQHPHILPALDYGEYRSWYYLVTPYIAGGSLHSYLSQKKILDVHKAGIILSQLASAIQYAHEHGTLHRDIKAANVLLRDPEYVYLTDFGLVKSYDDAYSLTQSGYLMGTPEYMAPELMEGEAVPASDIYALGVLLFIMLTGVSPFSGPTALSVMFKHLNEPAPPLSASNPAVPRAIELVVLRALAKNPGDRYPSASALMQAYQKALDEVEGAVSPFTTVSLTKAPLMYPSNKVAPLSPLKETPMPKNWTHMTRSMKKHSRLMGIACIVAVGLLSAFMFLSNSDMFNTNFINNAPAKQIAPGVTATVKSMSPPTSNRTSPYDSASRNTTNSGNIGNTANSRNTVHGGSQQRTVGPTSVATVSTGATPVATSVGPTPTPTPTSILSPILTPISILTPTPTASDGNNGNKDNAPGLKKKS
jgi:serine/threonine protein kinase